jgi:hypothetical protein
MTTIILACSFATYAFSPISMLNRVGALAAVGLLTALVADFLMTPILIYITKPFGKERSDIGKAAIPEAGSKRRALAVN